MGSSKSCQIYKPEIPVRTHYWDERNTGTVSYDYEYQVCDGSRFERRWVDMPHIKIYDPSPGQETNDRLYDINEYCSSTGADCNLPKSSLTQPSGYKFYNPSQDGVTYGRKNYSTNRCDNSTIKNYIADHKKSDNFISINDSNLYIKTAKVKYDGEFGGYAISAGPTARFDKMKPEKIKKDSKTIITYKTLDDMYFFCDSVFEDWLYLIQKSECLDIILKDIRSIVESIPGLIMLNRLNRQMKPLVDKYGESVAFVDLPFGPPMLCVNSQFVLPYKRYHANYKVNDIDKENNMYIDSEQVCNVVNLVNADISSKDFYKPSNYLDRALTELNNSCVIKGGITKDSVVTVAIPRRGMQLYEVVSDDVATSKNMNIVQGNYIVESTTVYQSQKNDNAFDATSKALQLDKLQDAKTTSAPLASKDKIVLAKLVAAFNPLDAMLGEAYTDLLKGKGDFVNVPVVNFIYEGETINIDINTLSESADNRMYLYCAKPSNALGSYIAGLQVSPFKETQLKFITINYDGMETKATPNMLMKRFVD